MQQEGDEPEIGLNVRAVRILFFKTIISIQSTNTSHHITMGGYLTQDPAVEKWVRMRESTAKHFRWNARNVRNVGILGLVIPAGFLYLSVTYDVRASRFPIEKANMGGKDASRNSTTTSQR